MWNISSFTLYKISEITFFKMLKHLKMRIKHIILIVFKWNCYLRVFPNSVQMWHNGINITLTFTPKYNAINITLTFTPKYIDFCNSISDYISDYSLARTVDFHLLIIRNNMHMTWFEIVSNARICRFARYFLTGMSLIC